MISLKFIPLTFITSTDEIIKQIRNTVVFAHLFETCEETTFSNYIETTQYGFTASALENGSHKMLRITDIHHSKVNWESVPFCNCEEDEKYLLKDNDILVARTGGTTGKSFFVENPPSNAIFASYLIRIRLKKDTNIEFINAFLNSYCFWSQIVEMKGGSAQPNVNAEKLKTLVMPDCDLGTQEKTVRLLKDENNSEFYGVRERINFVETLFWNNNQISTELSYQLELVSQLRQAFLREAMEGKLVEQDFTNGSAKILLKKIKAEKEKLIAEKKVKKEKNLPEIKAEEIPFVIPDNWTWCRLGDIAYLAGRIGWKGLTASEYTKEGALFLSVHSLNYGDYINFNEAFHISDERYDESPEIMLKNGDILICKDGAGIGKLGVVQNLKERATINSSLLLVRVDELNSKFIYYYLLSSHFQKIVMSRIMGATTPHLYQRDLVEFFVALPPLEEQKRIVEKLDELMKFCDDLEANVRVSKTQAENLLQVALKESLEPKEEYETVMNN